MSPLHFTGDCVAPTLSQLHNCTICQVGGTNATYFRLLWRPKLLPCGFLPLLLFWMDPRILMFCTTFWSLWTAFTVACSRQMILWRMVGLTRISFASAMLCWETWIATWTCRLAPFLLLQNLVICVKVFFFYPCHRPPDSHFWLKVGLVLHWKQNYLMTAASMRYCSRTTLSHGCNYGFVTEITDSTDASASKNMLQLCMILT